MSISLKFLRPEDVRLYCGYSDHGHDHESVTEIKSTETGMRAFVAIHNTSLGKYGGDGVYYRDGFGGIRRRHFQEYGGVQKALTDVLRLSRGMTFKNALAHVPFGGAKTVLYDWREGVNDDELFGALGDGIAKHNEIKKHRYFAAEDSGTSVKDMERLVEGGLDPYFIAGRTVGGINGDPSPFTARGVFASITVSLNHRGKGVDGSTVIVQGGGGNVGRELILLLHGAGAHIIMADTDKKQVQRMLRKYPDMVAIEPEDVYRQPGDVFSPCALGGILNEKTIPSLRCDIVVGAANNQLLDPLQDGRRLQERGILYGPDYVVNAGGVIEAYKWLRNKTPGVEEIDREIGKIGPRLLAIYNESEKRRQPTSVIADELARKLVYG